MKLRLDLSANLIDLDGQPLPLAADGGPKNIALQLGDMLVLDKSGPCLDYLNLALDLRKSPIVEISPVLRDQVRATVEASQHAVILVKGQIVNALHAGTEIK